MTPTPAGPQKTKIAILGGGLGAITTAFMLTDRPELRERFEVTVYQMGWRLGGKGRLPLSPKFSAYLAFAARTSSRILLIALASCSELSQRGSV